MKQVSKPDLDKHREFPKVYGGFEPSAEELAELARGGRVWVIFHPETNDIFAGVSTVASNFTDSVHSNPDAA